MVVHRPGQVQLQGLVLQQQLFQLLMLVALVFQMELLVQQSQEVWLRIIINGAMEVLLLEYQIFL